MNPLERELVALGAALDVPAGDFLATRVRARLRARPRRRRFGVVIAAAVVLAGALYANVPAVAEWFGVRGVEIRQEPPPPATRRGPLVPGRQVTLEQARALAGFDLAVPRDLQVDEVWFDDAGPTPTVWFVLGSPREFQGLLMQAKVRAADDMLAGKFAEPGMTIEPVTLGTGAAWWIEGAHSVVFYDQSGNVIVDRVRRAANVLLWERGEVTLRIESSFDRATSLRIAASVS